LYYRITRAAADERFLLDMAEFCVMRAMVRDAIVKDSTSFPFIRASIGRVGFDTINVSYKRCKRSIGETHYNLLGMLVFGMAGLLSSSTLWLRLPAYIFPFWLLITLGLAGIALSTSNYKAFVLLVTLSLIFLTFISVGVGLYVARTYKNGLRRPNFHVNYRKSCLKGRIIK